MVEYICVKCKKTFLQKAHHTRHMNRKFPCVKDEKDDNMKYDSLVKKIEYLEIRNNYEKERNDENLKLIVSQNKEIKKLEQKYTKEIKKIKFDDKIKKPDSITVILNTTPFGMEDTTFIDDHTSRKILNKGFQSLPEFIKFLHFNKNKPENHNVYMPNWRDKTRVLVFNGTDWNLENRDFVLDSLKDKGIDFIQRKYDELDENDKNDNVIIKKIGRFIESYETDNVDILNEDIQLVLYNNREMVEKSRKKNDTTKN